MEATIWLLLAACTPQPFVLVVEGDPVPKTTRPLVGGRGSSTDNWGAIVASDEDGDRIVALDLETDEPPKEIHLPSGWAPGAVSFANDAAAAVAQGAGSVVFFHVVPFEIDAVVPVCSDPRGIAYVPDSTLYAWVACGDGSLVQVDWSGPTGPSWFVAPTDLTHLFVHGAGDAFVATSDGGEVLRFNLVTGEVVGRYPLPGSVRRITGSADEGVYVLHDSDAGSQLTRIGWWDDAVTSAVVDASLALDVVAWAAGDVGARIPTPVVGAEDIGGGPGVKSVDPLGAPDDQREVAERPSFILTEGPVVGVALSASGPIAVTRDPFSIVSAEGSLVPSDGTP